MAALSQLSYSPRRPSVLRSLRDGRSSGYSGGMNSGTSSSSPGSPPAGSSPPRGPPRPPVRGCPPGWGDLVEPGGHRAVGQAHVAQQPLGVVAQRGGQLAQVARHLGAFREYLARDDMCVADDLARVFARVRAAAPRLFLVLLVEPDQLLAPRLQQPLGVSARLLGDAG